MNQARVGQGFQPGGFWWAVLGHTDDVHDHDHDHVHEQEHVHEHEHVLS